MTKVRKVLVSADHAPCVRAASDDDEFAGPIPSDDSKGHPYLVLTDEQESAIAALTPFLEGDGFAPILIHGVTGSGKTEIYLKAIEQVVARGREAIVLVPEISLTPQTIHRFRQRFARVAVLHSHLSDVERHRHWQSIAAGEVEVVVGAQVGDLRPGAATGTDRDR